MKVKVTYRLSVVLAERRIKTATAFAKLMTEYGYSLSTSQATRYLNEGNNAPALSLGFVEAACTVLRCSPGDLYEVVIYHEEGEAVQDMLLLKSHTITKQGEAKTDKQSLPQRAMNRAKNIVRWESQFGVSGPTISPIT